MLDLEAFINETNLDPITQAAIAHAQFETIHPYGDGNGRVGRVLVAWMLSKRLNVRVSPPISVQLSRDRGGYLSGLVLFQQGQSDPWVRWFAETVARSAESTIDMTVKVQALLSNWEDRLSHLRSDAVALRILAMFPERFVVTTHDVAEETGVSDRAARSALAELRACGVASQLQAPAVGSGRPHKLWIAPELVDLLSVW